MRRRIRIGFSTLAARLNYQASDKPYGFYSTTIGETSQTILRNRVISNRLAAEFITIHVPRHPREGLQWKANVMHINNAGT